MTDRPTLTRHAPAKINLALAVGPRCASDGMHPIASWMAPISLFDTVTVQRLAECEPSRFEIIWAPDAMRPTPIDWPIEADLAVRAVRAIEAEIEKPLPVAMRVEKRIPTGAGLGGGSSDAGAALLVVRELFGLDIPDDRLAAIASTLGSDVPFFLGDGPALVTGFGETITRTEPIAESGAIALLSPSFGCATGAVYAAFDSMEPREFRSEGAERLANNAVLDDAGCFNDLAEAAERVDPSLAQMRAMIESAASIRAHITGSGSAMFVLCGDYAEAERVIESTRRFVGSIAGAVVSFRQ